MFNCDSLVDVMFHVCNFPMNVYLSRNHVTVVKDM